MIRVVDTDGEIWYIPDYRLYYVRIKDGGSNNHHVAISIEGEATLTFAIDDEQFAELNERLTDEL